MHMHSANQHPPHNPRQIPAQIIVTVFVHVVLIFPIRKRMTRGGDGREVIFRRMFRHARAQAPQVFARLTNAFTDLGADLNLALQKLWADLIPKFGQTVLHHLIRCAGQLKAVAIHQ